MTPVPEKYADKPNLWRLACELAKFENPYKTLDMVLALAVPLLKEAGHDEQGAFQCHAEQPPESPGRVYCAAGAGKIGGAGDKLRKERITPYDH